MKIAAVHAHQIYDSRGHPTIEAFVRLENGVEGAGLVPAGASTGRHEAHELRDGDPTKFLGRSVLRSVAHVEGEIACAIVGRDVYDQAGLDATLLALDGTPDKSRLGANAVLAVSQATVQAAARARGQWLYEYLGQGRGTLLPLPEIQVFGGGRHAAGRVDVQDFMIIAPAASSYAEALEITHNVYHQAGGIMRERGALAGAADEGGYWPAFDSNEAALATLLESIERAGYVPGRDVALSLDVAASELWRDGAYELGLDHRRLSAAGMVGLLTDWCDRYPILSLEDPMAEDDWEGWTLVHAALGHRCQLIGDDLFTTNLARIERGIAAGVANAVLIKPNQIGTVSETLAAITRTEAAGWLPLVSARSGETEDTFIAHLAVATNAGQLKVGSFCRGERMVKWNEVLRIGRHLGPRARFLGGRLYDRLGLQSLWSPPLSP